MSYSPRYILRGMMCTEQGVIIDLGHDVFVNIVVKI